MARPKANYETKNFHKSIRLKPSTVDAINTYGNKKGIKGLSKTISYILEKEVANYVK